MTLMSCLIVFVVLHLKYVKVVGWDDNGNRDHFQKLINNKEASLALCRAVFQC